MRCPRCGRVLRISPRDVRYGLCDNCRRKFLLEQGGRKESELPGEPETEKKPEEGEKPKTGKKQKKRPPGWSVVIIAAVFILVLFLAGRAWTGKDSSDSSDTRAGAKKEQEEKAEKKPEKEAETSDKPEVLEFLDLYGALYQAEIRDDVEKHSYKLDAFQKKDEKMSYTGDDRYTYRLGVDVSHHQGTIDWKKVKEDGYEFALIRIGLRGYGEEGQVRMDKEFAKNIKNAQAAGIETGVYFFSQAVNEKEAKEEAEFVIKNLKKYQIQLPVAYDLEHIRGEKGRTDSVTGEQFTKNTKAFCQKIKKAGYEPLIYCNMFWEAYELDLSQLAEYPVWYADYEARPQTPYHFEFWQYSGTGHVKGISGNVDTNMQLIPR